MSVSKPLSTADVTSKAKEFYSISPETASSDMKDYLLDYCVNNRDEINQTPNRDLPTPVIVSLLMQYVDELIKTWTNEGAK